MAAPGFVSTIFLALRKTAYGESSLILDGLSPDRGRLRFMLRGARRLGRRQFPAADIFRLWRVSFKDSGRDLPHWHDADLEEDLGAIATRPAAFRTAAWLAEFALANQTDGLEHPRFFAALLNVFRELRDLPDDGRGDARAVTLAAIAYLDEAGTLDVPEAELAPGGRCRLLLDAALGQAPPPPLSAGTWSDLRSWAVAMLRHADCLVPGGRQPAA